MKRFRVRQWGQDDWTYIEIRGELAEGMHNILAFALDGWTSKLHIQEDTEGRWENLT
jgi:hypothetical protein